LFTEEFRVVSEVMNCKVTDLFFVFASVLIATPNDFVFKKFGEHFPKYLKTNGWPFVIIDY